jgi:hypothetical protein
MIVAGQRLPVLIATRPVDFRCCHQAENNPCNNAEGKQAINWTRLSCKGMAPSASRTAYNLGVFLQGTDLPEEMTDWSLTSLQSRLIKISARVVRHVHAIMFQLGEVAYSGDLFNRILAAIHRLRAPPVSS